MTEKFKYQIGEYVFHRESSIKPTKIVIISRGTMQEHGGYSRNLYVCSRESTWGVYYRMFLYEHDIVSAGEQAPASVVRSLSHEPWRELDGPFRIG